jgi:hypothetical protein
MDQKNITSRLSGLIQIIRSEIDQRRKKIEISINSLEEIEVLFLVKTKNPKIKATIAVGMWE